MKLLKCPRCKNEWQKSSMSSYLYRCNICNISYYHTEYNRGDCMALYLAKKNYYLNWELDDNNLYCTYSEPYHLSIRLPWLPFDINEDKLKLYVIMA